MSQRRIRAATLSDNSYGTLYPAPTTQTLDMTTLSGGLNLWELDYQLDKNQSPDCVNVYWRDGCLSSRRGQEYVYENTTETTYGAYVDSYAKLWQDYVIAHKGTALYKISTTTGVHTSLATGLSTSRGAGFFVFGDKLYYLGGGKYYQITTSFVATEVVPFTPTIIMNRTPAGTGGSAYQPENRLQAAKTVLFTSDGTATKYVLPVQDLDADALVVKVNTYDSETQTYSWITKVEDTDYTVDRTNGTLTFTTAPAQEDPEMLNNVSITYYKTNADAKSAIMNCTCACVYGGDTDLMVVLGGPSNQPNAYFWSGNTDVGIDPTYFPIDYYNYAGADAHQYITGFGRQQSLLIIFSENAVGKSSVDTTTISSRDYLTLPYAGINNSIGCDIPGSIQLVQNNLVFANTYGGVYVLADSSAANENNVKRISRNVNGHLDVNKTTGLLYDLSQCTDLKTISSYDDQQRYYLVVGDHVYLWDYTLNSYKAYEENLSWFYLTAIPSVRFVKTTDDAIYFKSDGSLVQFISDFVDFGSAFTRKYTFATQFFGSYERLKDVLKVIFAVRTDTDTSMNITYTTDYETRADRTPIIGYAWRLVPRNLAHRSLNPLKFAFTAVRIPRCFHIKHFTMTLTNSNAYSDMSVVNAQIIYRYVRKDR